MELVWYSIASSTGTVNTRLSNCDHFSFCRFTAVSTEFSTEFPVSTAAASYSTATVQYSTVQYSYSTAAASYGATPAQHEALDGNRRGVEGVLREYTDTALYYQSPTTH